MNERISFLPFHAINEFMRDDFRLSVIQTVLKEMDTLPTDTTQKLNKLINKHVNIPGFRNPAKAPLAVKLIPLVKAFEKNPDLVAIVLSAWVEGKPELRNEVYQMLKVRNWSFFSDEYELKDILNDWRILPIDADRTILPGFYTIWPKDETFEKLYDSYVESYPESANSLDSVCLMVVWIAMRLPYHVGEESNLEQEKNE